MDEQKSSDDPPKPTLDVSQSEATIEVDPQATEIRIDIYESVAEWIRFADAKAAVVLTVNGALASVLIPTLKPWLEENKGTDPCLYLYYGTIGLFALWMFFLICSSIWAFRCILPFRHKGKHPAVGKCEHFHPAAISLAYEIDETERFIEDCESIGSLGLQREVLRGLLLDAHISRSKYTHVTVAIRLLAWSAIFGFMYLLVSQF